MMLGYPSPVKLSGFHEERGDEMPTTFPISGGWIAASAAAIVFEIALTLALGSGVRGVAVTDDILTIFGLAALWIIWRLRKGPEKDPVPSDMLAPAQGATV